MNIIYNRVSTQEQNPENQIRDIVSSFKLNDYILYEEKESAWKDSDIHREKWVEIKKFISNYKITDLYVWDLDRIYRDRKKLIALFEYCCLYRCKIHSFRQKWLEQINNNPPPWNEIIHNLMLQIMGWLAEEESNKRSDRVKAAIRVKDGITKSYKGNKWGRKSFPKQTIDRVIKARSEGKTIRQISTEIMTTDKNNNQVSISKSAVHKILSEYLREKDSIMNCPETSQLVDKERSR